MRAAEILGTARAAGPRGLRASPALETALRLSPLWVGADVVAAYSDVAKPTRY